MVIYCGSDEPHRAFPPFMIASGALASEMEVTMFFCMSGLNIIRKGYAEKIVLPGAPMTMPEFLKSVQENGGKLLACAAGFPVIGMKEEELIDGTECVGAVRFALAAQDSGPVLTF